MDKRFLAIVILVIGLMGGVFWYSKDKSKQQSNSSPNTPAIQATNHTIGAGNKKVTLLEYGDFECPACGSYFPLVQQLKQQYGDDITFQFRHFPLVQIHPNAFAAHRAAEAAGFQNKFFEMHDILYAQQQSWAQSNNPVSSFETYAMQLGLDMDKFRQDYASEAVSNIINEDLKAGQAIGATSTPTFVLNGTKIENPRSIEDFSKLIDEEIAKTTGNNQ